MADCVTCGREYLDSYAECPFCARAEAEAEARERSAEHATLVPRPDPQPRSWAWPVAIVTSFASVIGVVAYLVIQVTFVGQATGVSDTADREACYYTQAVVERTAAVYRVEHGEPVPAFGTLVGDYLETRPVCPVDGHYLWDPTSQRLSCTVHGSHKIAGY